MDQVAIDTVVMDMLDQKLADTFYFESSSPVYEFRIAGGAGAPVAWTWTPQRGPVRGAAESPTCIVEIDAAAMSRMLSGQANLDDLLSQRKLRVSGLFDDALHLALRFYPPEARREADKKRAAQALSTHKKRVLAEQALAEVSRVTGGEPPPRIREMLALWVEHRLDHCRADQCLYMCFPDILYRPWHDTAELGIDALLLENHDALRDEALQFVAGSVRAPHYAGSKETPDTATPGRPQGWRHWNIVESFEREHGADELFPTAARIVDTIARDHTIVLACFLILEPGVRVPLHSDGGGWALSHHHGLLVPDGCSLTVAGERKMHRERESLLFNDSFMHEAVNTSDRPRVVFNVVVVDPALSAHERASIALLSKLLPKGQMIYVS
jgi:aspartyl/asparaginyl beta-hydroxylase (cupin superfamily)